MFITSDRGNRVSTAKLKTYFRDGEYNDFWAPVEFKAERGAYVPPVLINVKLETFVRRNPPCGHLDWMMEEPGRSD